MQMVQYVNILYILSLNILYCMLKYISLEKVLLESVLSSCLQERSKVCDQYDILRSTQGARFIHMFCHPGTSCSSSITIQTPLSLLDNISLHCRPMSHRAGVYSSSKTYSRHGIDKMQGKLG